VLDECIYFMLALLVEFLQIFKRRTSTARAFDATLKAQDHTTQFAENEPLATQCYVGHGDM